MRSDLVPGNLYVVVVADFLQVEKELYVHVVCEESIEFIQTSKPQSKDEDYIPVHRTKLRVEGLFDRLRSGFPSVLEGVDAICAQ